MYRHPLSHVTAARLAVLAALIAVLAGAAPASAQEGFGNYAAAAGASAAEQSPELNVPRDSRASVAAPRHGHRRSSR